MPAFNQYGPLTVQVGRGTTLYMIDPVKDVISGAFTSIVKAPCDAGPVDRYSLQFTIDWAVAPTAVVEIFGSNTYPTTTPQNGQILYTSTSKQHDAYTDITAYAFYWVQVISYSAGGALAVISHDV